MQKFTLNFLTTFMLVTVLLMSSGCTFIFQKGRRVDVEKISKLKRELSDLEKAKQELEDRLKNEIADKDVNVAMRDGNLVLTFVAEVLFDSGKAELKEGSFSSLDTAAEVINTTVRDLTVGIEGHTDTDPIKASGWKSNWELSVGRALSVLHHLIDSGAVSPERLSASGFGEYRPVASNETKDGKAKNRRVEIVIFPKVEKKALE